MRLRPYKSSDAKEIEKWIRDPDVFKKWGGDFLGTFPINAEIIHKTYSEKNGNCAETDNFYPWTAIDEDGRIIGHFIMRYIDGDRSRLRFGWVIIDETMRGSGYGQQMLSLGLRYAFEIYGVQKVTLGVYENNDPAHNCYKKAGFHDVRTIPLNSCNVVEMEILKQDYEERRTIENA